MLHKLDPKYDVPGRTRLKRLMDQMYERSKSQVLSALSSARFICGELLAGKRNRLCVSMEQRVFMKLNRQLLSKLSCWELR